VSDIDTAVADSLKCLTSNGRLEKPTLRQSVCTSAAGHVQTHAPQQTAPFNHCTQVGPSPAQPLLRFGFLGRRADPGQRREVPHSGMVEHM
jgi:hypothetical protein